MSAQFLYESPQLSVRVPHAVTICADQNLGTPEHNLPGVQYSEAPRAATYSTAVADLTLGNLGAQVDLVVSEHGEVQRLPMPQDNRLMVVSKLTILAAMRSGRPIKDLLFLYGDIREGERFVGVKGLGQPQPIERFTMTQNYGWPYGVEQPVDLVNTCPYPGKLFSADTPQFVPWQTEPQVLLPKPSQEEQTKVIYEEEINTELSERLRLPVYKTWAVGVENDNVQEGDQILRLANPNVLVALGSAARAKGYVTLGDEVRTPQGTILGGRSLAFFGPGLLDGPRI